MRVTVILLLTAGLAVADPKPGDEGTPEHQKAAALVKQLGDKRYAAREAAARKLVEMGPAAVPALSAGTKADDEEIRNRSIALLPQAKAAEWKRRAAAYLADTEGRQKHDLPLLAEWDKLVGKPEAGSRKLFAEMVRTNGELLEKAAADRKAGATACAERCKLVLAQSRTHKGQIKAELGDVAAILFVDTLSSTRSDWSTRAFPAQLLANPTTAEAMDAADTGPVIRRLLGQWMAARPANDPAAAQQFALLARKKPFPEAVPALVKLATDKTADVFTVRLLAIESLGKAGGKEAATALAGLVPDTTTLFGGPDEHRLGDMALAAWLTMHGKKLNEFGLVNNIGIGFSTGDGEEPISFSLHGFSGAAARDKAVTKWKAILAETKEKKDEKK